MSHTPDYRRYNLNQLYDVLRYVDREKHPDRLALIRSEIERQGGDPDKIQPAVFFVPPSEVTPCLRAVRWAVGIEYASTVLLLLYGSVDKPFYDALEGVIFVCTALAFYVLFCGIGLGMMRHALTNIRDHAAVEAGWIGAVGLAPLSMLFYVAIVGFILDRLNSPTGILVLVIPGGFYMPFILLTYFVKYRCREDEF